MHLLYIGYIWVSNIFRTNSERRALHLPRGSKVYAEVPGFTFSGVEAGVVDAPVMSIFEVEGRLRSHIYVDGEYHDIVIVGLDRGAWKGLASFLSAWNLDINEVS